MSEPTFSMTADDDLPRTLRRERESREREARERAAAASVPSIDQDSYRSGLTAPAATVTMPTRRLYPERACRGHRVPWSPLGAAALLATAVCLPTASAQAPGAWAPAFDHEVNTANTNQLAIPITHIWPPKFNAIHMALIPVGPHRGKVLVWDAPVRVFHWLMVLSFAGAWLTAEAFARSPPAR